MGRPQGWGLEQTGRPIMQSPGRPGVNQLETKRAFWNCVAQGMESEAAARACGVSQPLGPRWFRDAGGMPPIELTPGTAPYLFFSEREEIALLRAQDCGIREIARRLQRSPSTISRELRRTPQPVAVHCYTGRRLLSGKLSVPRNVRKLPDWPRTRD